MRRFALFFMVMIISASCMGQVEVTINQILGTAKKQSQFQLQERKIDFLKTTPYQLPFIDRWEIRTQTHDLDLSEQRLTFRVRPNSRKERKGQELLHFSTISYYQEESRVVLLKGLRNRYNTCLTLLFAKDRKQLLNDLTQIYADLSEQYDSKGLIEEMIDAEEDKEEYAIQLFDYQQNVERAIRQTQYYLSEKIFFDLKMTDLVSIKVIKDRIEETGHLTRMSNPSLSLLENEINMVDKELLITEAGQKKWLTFAQFRYGGSDSFTPFRETFNLAMAFRIPTKGSSFLKMNKLQLDKIASENEWGVASYMLQKERKNLLRSIQSWLDKHQQLTTKLIVAQHTMARNYAVKSTTDYEILSLKVRAHLLKKKLRIHKIEEKIFQAYVDWLGVTGKMIELPLVNYLTIDLQRF